MSNNKKFFSIAVVCASISLVALLGNPFNSSANSDNTSEPGNQTELTTLFSQLSKRAPNATVDAKVPTCTEGTNCGNLAIDEDAIVASLADHSAVGSATYHPAETQKATAIVLLQRHKSPGSKESDPINDPAVIAQKELAEIIETLHTDYTISNILMEGIQTDDQSQQTLYGDLNDARNRTMQINKLNRIIYELTSREDIPQDLRDSLVTHYKNFIRESNRSLLLDGAAVFAYANGSDVYLAGAETPETYQKSARIVVEYMQITNRLKQLSPLRGLSMGGTKNDTAELLNISDSDLQKLQKILQARKGGSTSLFSPPSSPTAPLESLSSVFKAIEESSTETSVDHSARTAEQILENIKHELDQNEQEKRVEKASATQVAVPADNYAQSLDTQALNKRLEEVSGLMEDVVVDQRNADTARNFVLMLEKTNSNVGMIQFGAQHRDGLIQELQNQGVSVIAITPKSLVR